MKDALGIITANYSARNPGPLVENRPLASVPYLGRYRVVDFAFSNMVNCGIRTVGLIMPHNYRSLIDHIGSGKDYLLDRKNGGLFILPGSSFGTSRTGSRFLLRDFEQNRTILDRDSSPYVVVSASNFVFNMDLDRLIDAHKNSDADITVLTKQSDEDNDDVVRFDLDDGRVCGLHHGVRFGETAFLDCFVIGRERFLEMLGWYETVDYLDLFEALERDYGHVTVRSFDYDGYVASVFDAKAYYRHNMDMLRPELNDQLFPDDRPILTKAHDNPPAKYERSCHVRNSLVSGGCVIAGSVTGSILGREVVVASGATLLNSIVLQSCIIESGARVENAIIDRNNLIVSGMELRGTPEDVLLKGKGN